MSATTLAPDEAEAPEKKKGGKKKLLMIVVVLLLGGGAAWWFMLRPASAEEELVPGEVHPLEAIQINLQDDHYLRIGLALQAVEGGGHGEFDGSKALDATIEIFTGESKDDLAETEYRHKLKKKLEHELEELYHHEVMGVYFTDFVTQ
ncbi:MAG: flagellar basal body-associated FliL family protein [Nocardioides sp.]